MTEEQIKDRIQGLKKTLTGDIFKDGDTQMDIYKLKLMLKPEIEDEPELDDDDSCLSCGA